MCYSTMNTDGETVARLAELLSRSFRESIADTPTSATRLAGLQAHVEILKVSADSPGKALVDITAVLDSRNHADGSLN